MSDDLTAWLRAEIEADKREANVKVIRKRWEIDPGSWATGTGIIGEDGRPVAVAIGDYAARHIVRHGPLDKLADCEAKLAILGMHPPMPGGLIDEMPTTGTVCRRCSSGPMHLGEPYPCRTVRLLASGYRHRDGYREEEWKP